MDGHRPVMPYLAALAAIAFYSIMDAAMKQAALSLGAYSATVLRNGVIVALAIPLWLRGGAAWPGREALVLHVKRGCVSAGMATSFFYALVRLPMADAIALSFIAPLIALGLAAVLLQERIERQAIGASLLGLAGVVVIALGRMEADTAHPEAAWGIAAVLVSAVLYAWNLILQRQQALRARPAEVAVFQNAVAGLVLLLAAPWLLRLPQPGDWQALGASAVLALVAVMLASWAYRRAEAQALVPFEYSAFIWAALMGWVMFAEPLTLPTIAGTALIVVACLIAAPRRRPRIKIPAAP